MERSFIVINPRERTYFRNGKESDRGTYTDLNDFLNKEGLLWEPVNYSIKVGDKTINGKAILEDHDKKLILRSIWDGLGSASRFLSEYADADRIAFAETFSKREIRRAAHQFVKAYKPVEIKPEDWKEFVEI